MLHDGKILNKKRVCKTVKLMCMSDEGYSMDGMCFWWIML